MEQPTPEAPHVVTPNPPRRWTAARRGGIAAVLVALVLGILIGASWPTLSTRVASLGGQLHLPTVQSPIAQATPAQLPARSQAAGGSQPAAGSQLASRAPATAGDLPAIAERVGAAVVSVRTDQGLGSGVIYDASGLILTNAHVVDGAETINIGLADGRHFAGKVLGTDAGFDLAIVRIDGQNLPTAPLGESGALRVGETVVAIGNPYGFDHTVTTGVVSALNRPISEGQASYSQPMIQTDAAINPGNSGGPLVDLRGNVVGITTLVAAPQGFPAQGLGFAVPIDTARRIAPQLVEDGHVTHSGQPYLGVALSDASVQRSQQPRLPGSPGAGGRARPGQGGQGSQGGQGRGQTTARMDHGARVESVEASGPADKGGLKQGDIITQLDGREVYTRDDLLQDLVLHRPGDQVALGVNRGGQQLTVTITLGEAPAR
ncbi:MAG: trypsin-like peptidase domain-containing protein [Chloroflexi bacterium]|nr:trypsin-like peptidase domain-containing protein [Chloroflexota bacterium]